MQQAQHETPEQQQARVAGEALSTLERLKRISEGIRDIYHPAPASADATKR